MSMSLTGSSGLRGSSSNKRGRIGGYDVGAISKYSPEVLDLIKRLQGSATPGLEGGIKHLSELAAGGTPEMWEQLEAPAMRQFSGLQGNLASRFSGMGTGARKSSGFGNTMSAAAQQLSEGLQSQRMGLQQGAIKSLYEMVQDLLGRQEEEKFLMEPKKKGWEKWLSAGLPIAGGIAGGIFGGPAGAMLGANIGGAAGRSFL